MINFALEPKIRVSLPAFLYEIINGDVIAFEINPNRLCNIIFRYYGDKIVQIEPQTNLEENSKILQFTLTQDSMDYFAVISDTLLST